MWGFLLFIASVQSRLPGPPLVLGVFSFIFILKALGDDAFSFQFEDSDLLSQMMDGQTKESHPEMFTEHCWNVENRGAVGETTFHVCFLMGTPTHMYCAKR